MIGWRTERSWWPLIAIASLGSASVLPGCSGKVRDTRGCGTNASCGGSGGTGQGGNGATSGNAQTEGGASATPDACENGLKDSDEADVDCGGSGKCAPCTTNSRCTSSGDCETGICASNRCAEATCTDRIKDQDETGVDCGGTCPPCDFGKPCAIDEDCAGGTCANAVCVDHCVDRLLDADESDVDCGGPTCSPCMSFQRCRVAADCASSACAHAVCQVATCSDQIKNQDETDIDCGGACSACPSGAHCNADSDCDSYVCAAGKCKADITVAPADVIDDFEDGDLVLPTPARAGRVGAWYSFGDGTGTGKYQVAAINRGASADGLHVTGMGYSNWGSGFAVDLNNTASGQATRSIYDASAYAGITFWARAQAPTKVTVSMPDSDTDKAGNLCSICDHHYYGTVALTTNWQRFTLAFSDLVLEPGSSPVPAAFKPSGLVSIQFRFTAGVNYEADFDDLAFLKQ